MRPYPSPFACLFALSCAASPDALDDSQPVPQDEYAISLGELDFARVCEQTNDRACDQCEAKADAEADECFSLCLELLDPSCLSTCERIVSSDTCYVCDDDPKECRSYGFEFTETAPLDPEIFEACRAAVARDQRCEETNVGENCERFSVIERAEVTTVYACVADTACGEPTDDCFDALGMSDLGEHIAASCDVPLGDNRIAALDGLGAWERPEVNEALEICATRHCSNREFTRCVDAWIEFTFGN